MAIVAFVSWVSLLLILFWTFTSFLLYTSQQFDHLFSGRNGHEVYSALFGSPPKDCVEVIQYRDQLIPIIDYGIFLHAKVCPGELQRILQQNTYNCDTMINAMYPPQHTAWFTPETLGDTILRYQYIADAFGNGTTIYTNTKGQQLFVDDIAE